MESSSNDEIDMHVKDLDALKTEDPEFYEFLKSNDKNLLNFGADESDVDQSDDDEEMDMDDEVEDEAQEDEEAQDNRIVITADMVSSWNTLLKEKFSLNAVKKVAAALSYIVKSGGENEEMAEQSRYRVLDARIHGLIIICAVQSVPAALNHHLNTDGSTKLPSESAKWSKLKAIIKAWLKHLVELLNQLSDATMLDFMAREMVSNNVVAYFACFENNSLGKQIVKKVLAIWSEPPNVNYRDDEAAEKAVEVKQRLSLKLGTFVFIRKLAECGRRQFLDMILKVAYKNYQNASRNLNWTLIPHLNFLQNCLIELFRMDSSCAYQHCFVGIRQVAMKVRNAMTQRNDESTKQLYSWQVVYSIKFLCKCVSSCFQHFVNDDLISKLVFPLAQTTLGLIKHAEGQHFYPLRIHMIKSLVDLSRGTKIFIPVSAPLLKMCEEIHALSKQKPSTLKPLDWDVHFRAPASFLRTQPYVDDVIDRLFDIFLEFMALWSSSIAYPELSAPVETQLKRMSKECKNPKFVKQAKLFLDKLKENREYILEKRKLVDFGPSNLDAAKAFSEQLSKTPLNVHYEGLVGMTKMISRYSSNDKSHNRRN